MEDELLTLPCFLYPPLPDTILYLIRRHTSRHTTRKFVATHLYIRVFEFIVAGVWDQSSNFLFAWPIDKLTQSGCIVSYVVVLVALKTHLWLVPPHQAPMWDLV
jgi:hypothetical protein